MATLKLYYDLMSQPSRALFLFLRLNKIPYTDKPVALRRGEHFREEFTAINPFQKVPVLDDDGFVLTESVAQLKYLCTKYPVSGHWYPAEVQQRARVDEYLAWQHWNTRLNGAMVFRTKIIEPRAMNKPVDKKKLNRFKAELDKTLDHVESYFLRDRPYLCGHDMTLADLLCICELQQPVAAGHDVYANRPVLSQWETRVKARLQPHFDEASQMVYKLQSITRAESTESTDSSKM